MIYEYKFDDEFVNYSFIHENYGPYLFYYFFYIQCFVPLKNHSAFSDVSVCNNVCDILYLIIYNTDLFMTQV